MYCHQVGQILLYHVGFDSTIRHEILVNVFHVTPSDPIFFYVTVGIVSSNECIMVNS